MRILRSEKDCMISNELGGQAFVHVCVLLVLNNRNVHCTAPALTKEKAARNNTNCEKQKNHQHHHCTPLKRSMMYTYLTLIFCCNIKINISSFSE